MKALQYESTEILKSVSMKEQQIKNVNAKLKSAIQFKKTVSTSQTGFVKFLNDNMFTLDFRYIPGTDNSSLAITQDSENTNALEIYGKTKNGQATINLGADTNGKS